MAKQVAIVIREQVHNINLLGLGSFLVLVIGVYFTLSFVLVTQDQVLAILK